MLGNRYFMVQRRAAPYVFVAPFVVLFLLFGLYPLIQSLILSFYITNGPKSREYVGLANFVFLFKDQDFLQAVKNTSIFAFFSVFLQLPLSLGLALLLNSRLVTHRNFFRFSFFSPHLFGQVFVAVLFTVIFAPKFGLLNVMLFNFLESSGLNNIVQFQIDTKWLQNAALVMPALVLTSLWMYVGFNMIYFLAALQAVDKTLYEAAMVDGANAWQQFVHVTVPGIKPVAVFVLVLSTIGSFQLFELPYVMLGNSAGPEGAGRTIVMHLYDQGFQTGDLGYASAIGWSLAIGVMFVAVIQIKLSGTLKADDTSN